MVGVRVSVLIVSWNTHDLLADCLESLEQVVERPDLEIIVVDNGSCDGTAAMVTERYPAVTLIPNTDNAGFARSVNQAFTVSEAPFVLLLNSDCRVWSGTIAHCRKVLEQDDTVGVVGCRIEYPDGSPQNSIFRYPSIRGVLSTTSWMAQAAPGSQFLNHDRYGLALPSVPTDVEVVMGSFLMVRRSDHAHTLLDDGYFMYAEEADLCRRLAEQGLRVRFDPGISVSHVRGASSSTSAQRAWSDEAKKRSLLRYLRKWHGLPNAWLANLIMTAGMLPRMIGWLVVDLMAAARGRTSGSRLKSRALPFHLRAVVLPGR